MEHPEQQDGEMFLTNATNEAFYTYQYRTKRQGVTALDVNGEYFRQYNPGIRVNVLTYTLYLFNGRNLWSM